MANPEWTEPGDWEGEPRPQDRTILGDALCRAMEPEAWAEYDAGNGVCSNQAGWKCMDSIRHAGAVMNYLATLGAVIVPPKAAKGSALPSGPCPRK